MKYDYFHEYCSLAEELHNEAMNALFSACIAEDAEREEEACQHRAIRMILAKAYEQIAIILAEEEERNPDIPEVEYSFFGKERVRAHFLDNYFEVERKEYAI